MQTRQDILHSANGAFGRFIERLQDSTRRSLGLSVLSPIKSDSPPVTVSHYLLQVNLPLIIASNPDLREPELLKPIQPKFSSFYALAIPDQFHTQLSFEH